MIYRHHGDGYAVEDNSAVLPWVTSRQLARLVTMGYEMPRPRGHVW
jgi:hypothetical protein